MVPSQTRVVIIGGGIMGCGLAYHLAHEGWTDVVLLEKAELTSGSTWHAAGQITHSTSSYALGKCVGYNIDLYSNVLEAETGQSVTWHGCGSLRLAYNDDELDWHRHTTSVGAGLGFSMGIIGPKEIGKLHPFYNLDGVKAALYTPDDGHVDPAGAAFALAKGARQLGVKIIRQCRATDVSRQPNGEWIVQTEQGDITCEHVVNAGGTYARQVAEWSGYDLPTTSMSHHYFITDRVPEFENLPRELPVVRDDRLVSGYIRMEQKSGLIGIYEKTNPNTVWEDHCPWEAEHELFAPDYDRIMPWLQNAMERMPVFAELGIKREVHGALSHPPDGNPLIGPAPALQNYWCCCGTQIGIGWGPGLTRELARWMVHGAADISMREFDPRRFGKYADRPYQITKAKEDYLSRHEVPFPHLNRLEGRPNKTSPLYARLMEAGAVYEEIYGLERPRWFARGSTPQEDIYGFGRTALHNIVGAEVRAVRSSAGLMDISAFAKIELTGLDAARVLDPLIANALPSAPGRIALSHILNETGRIELEATVIRLSDTRFYLVCAAFFEQRLIDHLNAHRGDAKCEIINRSETWAALALNGPRSLDILAACTSHPLDTTSFPWLRAREIDIAGHTLWALRLSYAGELGWEFHGTPDAIAAAYDALWSHGEEHGAVNYGSFAMNSMRMEKGFKGASELTNEVSLPEADVMRFVRTDKDFVGKAATLKAAENPLRWTCAYIEIEEQNADGHGGEAVFFEDRQVGTTSSVAFGHVVNKLLAFGYVAPECSAPGTELEVMIMGNRIPARVLGAASYDPDNAKPRSGGV